MQPDRIETASTLYDEGKYREAELIYRDVARANPKDGQAFGGVGACLFKLKRYAEAESFYRRAAALGPSLVHVRHGLGATLLYQGKHEEGESFFRACLEMNPDYTDSRFALAQALNIQGQYAEAYELFLALPAALQDKERERIATCKGKLYPQEAARDADAAGLKFLDEQSYPEAEAAFSKAAALQPRVARYSSNAANLREMLGQFARALPLREAAAQWAPYNAGYAADLAACRDNVWVKQRIVFAEANLVRERERHNPYTKAAVKEIIARAPTFKKGSWAATDGLATAWKIKALVYYYGPWFFGESNTRKAYNQALALPISMTLRMVIEHSRDTMNPRHWQGNGWD